MVNFELLNLYSRITALESKRSPIIESSLEKGLTEYTRENFAFSWQETLAVLSKVASWNRALVGDVFPVLQRQAQGVVDKRGLSADCVMMRKLSELRNVAV